MLSRSAKWVRAANFNFKQQVNTNNTNSICLAMKTVVTDGYVPIVRVIAMARSGEVFLRAHFIQDVRGPSAVEEMKNGQKLWHELLFSTTPPLTSRVT